MYFGKKQVIFLAQIDLRVRHNQKEKCRLKILTAVISVKNINSTVVYLVKLN